MLETNFPEDKDKYLIIGGGHSSPDQNQETHHHLSATVSDTGPRLVLQVLQNFLSHLQQLLGNLKYIQMSIFTNLPIGKKGIIFKSLKKATAPLAPRQGSSLLSGSQKRPGVRPLGLCFFQVPPYRTTGGLLWMNSVETEAFFHMR